jgi:hypothetical protein
MYGNPKIGMEDARMALVACSWGGAYMSITLASSCNLRVLLIRSCLETRMFLLFMM